MVCFFIVFGQLCRIFKFFIFAGFEFIKLPCSRALVCGRCKVQNTDRCCLSSAHPQHSIRGLTLQAFTSQGHYNLVTCYSLVCEAGGWLFSWQDRAQIRLPSPPSTPHTSVVNRSNRSLSGAQRVMDSHAENGAPSPSFCSQIHPWPHYLPGQLMCQHLAGVNARTLRDV